MISLPTAAHPAAVPLQKTPRSLQWVTRGTKATSGRDQAVSRIRQRGTARHLFSPLITDAPELAAIRCRSPGRGSVAVREQLQGRAVRRAAGRLHRAADEQEPPPALVVVDGLGDQTGQGEYHFGCDHGHSNLMSPRGSPRQAPGPAGRGWRERQAGAAAARPGHAVPSPRTCRPPCWSWHPGPRRVPTAPGCRPPTRRWTRWPRCSRCTTATIRSCRSGKRGGCCGPAECSRPARRTRDSDPELAHIIPGWGPFDLRRRGRGRDRGLGFRRPW
jgi:hypothetical protein